MLLGFRDPETHNRIETCASTEKISKFGKRTSSSFEHSSTEALSPSTSEAEQNRYGPSLGELNTGAFAILFAPREPLRVVSFLYTQCAG